jgi:hypothetical protein
MSRLMIAPFFLFARVVFAPNPETEREDLLSLLRAEFRAELDARRSSSGAKSHD